MNTDDLPELIKSYFDNSDIPVTYEEALKVSNIRYDPSKHKNTVNPERYGVASLDTDDFTQIRDLTSSAARTIAKNLDQSNIELIESLNINLTEKIMQYLSYDNVEYACNNSEIIKDTVCNSSHFWAKYVMGDIDDAVDVKNKTYQRKYKYTFFGKNETNFTWKDAAYALNYGYYGVKEDAYIMLSYIDPDLLPEDVRGNINEARLDSVSTCLLRLLPDLDMSYPFVVEFSDIEGIESYFAIVPLKLKSSNVVPFEDRLFYAKILNAVEDTPPSLVDYMNGIDVINTIRGIMIVDPTFKLKTEDECDLLDDEDDEIDDILDRAEYEANY